MKTLNPELVTLAREARGLTQVDLARALNVTQGKISKLEAGLLHASLETVEKLSVALKYPSDFFYQTDRRFGIGPAEFYHYRKKKRVASGVLSRHHARIDIRRIQITRLLEGVDISASRDFPHFDIDDFDADAAEVARALKAAWHVPQGPIRNLTALVEAAGGVVVPHDFESARGVDAVSRHAPPLPPLFFMNFDVGGARYRFSLAHDIAHMVMHNLPSPQMEDEADTFASEFLMPESEIKPHLAHLTLQRAANLASFWRVSIAAVVKRAADLGKLAPSRERKLWAEISTAGYRLLEPVELNFPPEEPTFLRRLIETYMSQLGYSRQELAKLLRVNEDELDAFESQYRAGLRLVRS